MASIENLSETNCECEKMVDKLKSIAISDENSVKTTACPCSFNKKKTETDSSKSTNATPKKENCASCVEKHANGFTNGNNSNHSDATEESKNPELPSTNGSGSATSLSQDHLNGSLNHSSVVDTSSASFFSMSGEETFVASPGSESMVTASECASSSGSQSSLSSETSNSPSSSVVSTELVSPDGDVAQSGLVVSGSPSAASTQQTLENPCDDTVSTLCDHHSNLNNEEDCEVTEVEFIGTPEDLPQVLKFINLRTEKCTCFCSAHEKIPEKMCNLVLHREEERYQILSQQFREILQTIKDKVSIQIIKKGTKESEYANKTLNKTEEAKIVSNEQGGEFIEEYQRLKGMHGLPYEFVLSRFPTFGIKLIEKMHDLIAINLRTGMANLALVVANVLCEIYDHQRVKLVRIIKKDPSLKDVNVFFENLCLSFQQLKYLVQLLQDIPSMRLLEEKLGTSWFSLSVDLFNHIVLSDNSISFYNLVCSEMVRRKMEIKAEHSIQEIEQEHTDSATKSNFSKSLSPSELEECNINMVWWPTVQYIKEIALKECKEKYAHDLAIILHNRALKEIEAKNEEEKDDKVSKDSSCACFQSSPNDLENFRSNYTDRPINSEMPSNVLRDWDDDFPGDVPTPEILKNLLMDQEEDHDEEDEEEEHQECEGCSGHHGPVDHGAKTSGNRVQANSLPRNKQPNTFRKRNQQNSRISSSKSNSSPNSRGDDYGGAGGSMSPSSEGADSNCDVGPNKHGCNCCYCHKQHNRVPLDGREHYSERQERLLRILDKKKIAQREREVIKRKAAEARSQNNVEDIDSIVQYILSDQNQKTTKKEKRKMAADRRKKKQDENVEASDSVDSNSNDTHGPAYKSLVQQKDIAKKIKADKNARKRDLSESSSCDSRSSSNRQMQESSRSSSSRDGNLENLLDQDGTIAQLRRRAPDVTVTVVKPENIKQDMQARGRSTITKSKEVEGRYNVPNQQHPLTSTYSAPSQQMGNFGANSAMGPMNSAAFPGFKQQQQGETRGLSKILNGMDKSKEEAPKDTKDQQMVTIRRVMDPVSAEPTVTITVKGEETNDEKLLYKLVNGHTVPNSQAPQQSQRIPLQQQQQQQMYHNTNVHHQQQNIQQPQYAVPSLPRPPPHLTPKQKKKWKQQQRKEQKKREEMEQEREIQQRKHLEVMQYNQQQMHLKQQEEALRQQTLENQRQQQHLKYMRDAALMNSNHQQMVQQQQQETVPKKAGKKGKRKGNYEEPPLPANLPIGVNISRVPGDPSMVNLSRNHSHGVYNPHHPMMHQPQMPLNHQMIGNGMVNGHSMIGMHSMYNMQQMPIEANHNLSSYHNPQTNIAMPTATNSDSNNTTRKNKKKNRKGKKGKVIEDEQQSDIEEEKSVEEPEEEEVEEVIDIRGWTEEEKIQGVIDGVITKDRLNNKLKRKLTRAIREKAEAATKAPEPSKPEKNTKTNQTSEPKSTKQKPNLVANVTRNSPMLVSEVSSSDEECVSDGEDLMDHIYNLNIGKKDAIKNLSVAGLSISCAAKEEANNSSNSRDVSATKKMETVKKSSSKGSVNENVAASNKKQQQSQATKDNKNKSNNEKSKPALPKKAPVISKKEENKNNVAKKKDTTVNQNRNSSFVPVRENSIPTTVSNSNKVQKKKNDSKASTKSNTENVKNKPENDCSKNTQKKKTPSESSSSSKSSNKQQSENRQAQQPKSHQTTQQQNQPQKQQSNQHTQHQSVKSTQSHQTPNVGENKSLQHKEIDLNIYRNSAPSVLQECIAKSDQLTRNRLSGMISNHGSAQQKPMNFMPAPQPSPFNMQPQQQQQLPTGLQNSMNIANNRLGNFSPSIGEPGGYANSFGSLLHNTHNNNNNFSYNSSNSSVFNTSNSASLPGSSSFGALGSSFGVQNNTAGRYNNLDTFGNSQYQPEGQYNFQSLSNMSTNLGIPNNPTSFSSSIGVDSSNQHNRFFTNQNLLHGGMSDASSSRSYGGLMNNSFDSSAFMRGGLNPGQAADFGMPYGSSSIGDGAMEQPKKDVGVIGKNPKKNRLTPTVNNSMNNSANLMPNYSNFGYPPFNSSYQNDHSNQ